MSTIALRLNYDGQAKDEWMQMSYWTVILLVFDQINWLKTFQVVVTLLNTASLSGLTLAWRPTWWDRLRINESVCIVKTKYAYFNRCSANAI